MTVNNSLLNQIDVRRQDRSQFEVRSHLGELRAVDDEGVFEGYIAVWDSVDSYGSKFAKGAFKKTLQERGNKVKVFYNHSELVGKPLEIREDDYGVFVRGKLNMDVQTARDALAFMKDGTLEGLSFGFRAVKQRYTEGVREITEVKLFEFGPVIFPANDEAVIQQVRGEAMETRVRQNARRPAYDGTEDTSWGEVKKTFTAYRDGYYKHTDAEPPEEPPTDVSDAPQQMKSWIASKTLLGEARADEVGDLLFFPVVNPDTNQLNQGALNAVLSGRGAQADVSEDQLESARSMVRTLLEQEFDVETEGRTDGDIVMNPEGNVAGSGGETRATNFSDTYTEENLRLQGSLLQESLWITLMDIWFDSPEEEIVQRIDEAIQEFAANYLEWARAKVDQMQNRSEGEEPEPPIDNSLALAMYQHRRESGATLETLARDTSLTYGEARSLSRGEPIEARTKLDELPEPVKEAHQEVRGQRVEALVQELRAGLSPAVTRRVYALLGNQEPEAASAEETRGLGEAIASLRQFRESLQQGN